MGVEHSQEPPTPDPALIQNFAVFRELPSGTIDSRQAHVIERMSAHLRLVADRATHVAVAPPVTLIVIPGAEGAGVIIGTKRRDGTVDYSATFGHIDSLLKGNPLMSAGQADGTEVILGLAPDGVSHQPVKLRDGTTVSAPVLNNVYAVTGPGYAAANPDFRG